MGKIIGGILVVLLLVLGGFYFYTQFTYSEGERAGLLIKFSNKGYFFKTYEGELNLGGVNTSPNAGLMNNIWAFSVNDSKTAKDLEKMEGKYIRLHYRQIMKNLPWQGETVYFVDKVESVNQ